MNASFGRYLDVDLSTGGIRDYEIPESWAERHLGGRGIGARLLLDLLAGREAALSPENVLVFATGPFQGTGLLGAGRHVVMGISPKTGSVADSYVGGYLGHELGRSGYDGILLRGKASAPIYLTLIDGAAKLHPARDLWGKGTGETETILKARHPGGRVASIGIAGENLVQMACIIHDRSRAAGRPGFGAVMGSKLLKAIVVRGNTEKSLHDRDRFARERAQYARALSRTGHEAVRRVRDGRGGRQPLGAGTPPHEELPGRRLRSGRGDRRGPASRHDPRRTRDLRCLRRPLQARGRDEVWI